MVLKVTHRFKPEVYFTQSVVHMLCFICEREDRVNGRKEPEKGEEGAGERRRGAGEMRQGG